MCCFIMIYIQTLGAIIMEKLRMLGTGSAMVTKCYNTCFTISNNEENEYFLVDTGGGNTILSNLEKAIC